MKQDINKIKKTVAGNTEIPSRYEGGNTSVEISEEASSAAKDVYSHVLGETVRFQELGHTLKVSKEDVSGTEGLAKYAREVLKHFGDDTYESATDERVEALVGQYLARSVRDPESILRDAKSGKISALASIDSAIVGAIQQREIDGYIMKRKTDLSSEDQFGMAAGIAAIESANSNGLLEADPLNTYRTLDTKVQSIAGNAASGYVQGGIEEAIGYR